MKPSFSYTNKFWKPKYNYFDGHYITIGRRTIVQHWPENNYTQSFNAVPYFSAYWGRKEKYVKFLTRKIIDMNKETFTGFNFIVYSLWITIAILLLIGVFG